MEEPPTEHWPRHPLLLSTYDNDLRTLISQDFQPTVHLPIQRPTPEDTFGDRIEKGGRAEETVWKPERWFVERLSGALLGCGIALIELRNRWPERQDLTDLYCRSARLERGLAVPPMLARALQEVQRRWSAHADWLLDVCAKLHFWVSTLSVADRNSPAMAQQHFQMRCWLSRQVRTAEVMTPEVVAAAELAGTVFFLRRASFMDLALAWNEGGRKPQATIACMDNHDRYGDLIFERALEGVLGGPSWDVWNRPDEETIEMLHFALAVRQQDPELARTGLLQRLDLPEDTNRDN